MSLMLDKDESFSLSAYVTSAGEQTIALHGYLVDHGPDGTYIAPLIPELFYGANGNQLIGTWRQNFTSTGDQVVLSRSGGLPTLPREELNWRKISETHIPTPQVQATLPTAPLAVTIPWWVLPLALLGIVVGGIVVYYKVAK
jgi:hypothetical protein